MIRIVPFLLLFIIPFGPVKAQENGVVMPPLVRPGEHGYLKGELIFGLEERPTLQCHASTIAETEAGPVVAWFGGTREKDADVGIWISRMVEERWSEPVEVANGIQEDGSRYPCWNPVLFQVNGGPLLLFYKVGPSPRDWWGEMKESGDGGRSWSGSRRLGEDRLGHLIGPVKNKPVMLGDGRLLCPSSTEKVVDGETFWQVHFEVTRDLGRSWEVIGPVNDGITFDAIQPSILTYGDDRLQILCRTMQDVVSESWSADGGRSWSRMQSTPLPNPSAGIDALTLKDGRQLVVYNHSTGARSAPGRSVLNLALSTDGQAWQPVMTLEDQKGEFSYPAVIQTGDGLLHITYTYDRSSIKHVVIDPEALTLPGERPEM